jgi:hypothetical protein
MSRGEAGRYGNVQAFNLDIRNPKVIKAESLPGFNSLADAIKYREGLQAQGFDGLVVSAKHLGGEVHIVAFEPSQVIRPKQAGEKPAVSPAMPKAAEPAKAEVSPYEGAANEAAARRPDLPAMVVTDETGAVVSRVTAVDYLAQALDEANARVKDAELLRVAANCFIGGGA